MCNSTEIFKEIIESSAPFQIYTLASLMKEYNDLVSPKHHMYNHHQLGARVKVLRKSYHIFKCKEGQTVLFMFVEKGVHKQ